MYETNRSRKHKLKKKKSFLQKPSIGYKEMYSPVMNAMTFSI